MDTRIILLLIAAIVVCAYTAPTKKLKALTAKRNLSEKSKRTVTASPTEEDKRGLDAADTNLNTKLQMLEKVLRERLAKM